MSLAKEAGKVTINTSQPYHTVHNKSGQSVPVVRLGEHSYLVSTHEMSDAHRERTFKHFNSLGTKEKKASLAKEAVSGPLRQKVISRLQYGAGLHKRLADVAKQSGDTKGQLMHAKKGLNYLGRATRHTATPIKDRLKDLGTKTPSLAGAAAAATTNR